MMNKKMNTEELITENRRYVEAVAKQYLNQGLTLEQLIEEGNKGLEVAAERFDQDKGCAFMSFAVWWVRQSILQALVNYSSGGQSTLSERERSIRLGINEGRPLADIAKEWGITEKRVQQIYCRSIFKEQKHE